MNLHIFKTNILTIESLEFIIPVFKENTNILKWSIDIEDVDKVLKVNTQENTSESDIINLVTQKGFFCEVLSD